MTPEQGVSRNKEDYFWCKLVRTQGSFFLTDILFFNHDVAFIMDNHPIILRYVSNILTRYNTGM
jgi:hypothetical protein